MDDSLLSGGGGGGGGGKNGRKKTKLSSAQPEGNLFACDNCLCYPLETVRHRCRVCQDFDLCDKCFQDKVHGHHEFMPIPISSAITSSSSSSSQTYGPAAHSALATATATAEAAARELPRVRPDAYAGMNPFAKRMTVLLDEVKVRIPLQHYNAKAGQEFMTIFDQSRVALASTKSQVPINVLKQILVRTALAQLGSKTLKSSDNFVFAYEPEPAGLFTLMQALLLQFLGSSSAPKEEIQQLYLELTTDLEFDKDFAGFFDWVRSGLAEHSGALCLLGLGELREVLTLSPDSPNAIGTRSDVQALQTMDSKLADAKVKIPMRERSVGFAQSFLSYCQSDEPALVRTAAILAGGSPLPPPPPSSSSPPLGGDEAVDSLLLLFLNQVKSFDSTQRLDVPKGVYFVNREISQDLFCKCVKKVLGEITDGEARKRCSSAFRDLLQSLGIQLVDMDAAAAAAAATASLSETTTSTEATPPIVHEAVPVVATAAEVAVAASAKEASDIRALAVKLRRDLENAHARIDVLALLLKESLAAPLLYGLDKVGRH